jgi:hypothetical protein
MEAFVKTYERLFSQRDSFGRLHSPDIKSRGVALRVTLY